MTTRLSFIVPGEPVPCERARAMSFMKEDGRSGARMYTPGRTDEFEKRVALFTQQALARTPEWQTLAHSDVRFRVHLHFVTSRPNGDKDNFEKAVLDGMKKANVYRQEPPRLVRGKITLPRKVFVSGVYKDDVRVTEGLTSIQRTKEREPRTEIMVEQATLLLEVPLWMQLAIEHGWKPEAMMQGSVT